MFSTHRKCLSQCGCCGNDVPASSDCHGSNNSSLSKSGSRVSSGGIVSDYGLDDRAIEVRSPAGEKDFSSILCV
jgi:hypothetical protein